MSCFTRSTLRKWCLRAVGTSLQLGFRGNVTGFVTVSAGRHLKTLEGPRGRLRKEFDPAAGATVWRRQIRNGRQVANQSRRKAAALFSTTRSILACALRHPDGTSVFQQSVPLCRLRLEKSLAGTKMSGTSCLTSRQRSITASSRQRSITA